MNELDGGEERGLRGRDRKGKNGRGRINGRRFSGKKGMN